MSKGVKKAKVLNWKITDNFGKKEACCLKVKLENSCYAAFIKWDGCCEIYRYHNNCKNDYDQIHICNISEFIEVLKSLEEFRMNNIENSE
ncbi:MAG: hypothetical protein ACUZ9M_00535 [Candidatus Scalindua sp.]